jgi:predicted nucleic acid-binding protein
MPGEAPLLDTNILVHAYILLHPKKHTAARDLVLACWQEGGGLTTLQNLCEFFVVATRKVAQPMPVADVATIVDGFLESTHWRVLDRQPVTVGHAMDLVHRYRIPFWDALIAATMLEHNMTTLITENEKDFRRVPDLQILNPFKARA